MCEIIQFHFNLSLHVPFFCRYLYSRGSGDNQKVDVGVCSNYLTNIEKDEEIKFEIDRTRFNHPADPSSSLLFICTVRRELSFCFLFILIHQLNSLISSLTGYRVCSNAGIVNATCLFTTSRTAAWSCSPHFWYEVFKRRLVLGRDQYVS